MNYKIIKFRVWDNKKKIWLDKTDFCIYNGDAQEVEIGGTEYLYNSSSYNPLKFVENDIGGLYCNRNLIIQQYTGLNDKNNKPIYEGDIVKYKTWTGSYDGTTEEHQTQVQFKDGAYYPRYIDDECEDSWYSFKVYDLEVVGNVFETPHLDENE